MNFLIVGSGPTGIFAAEAIRGRDRESPITMITADHHVAHSPVMLTYWMAGDLPREGLFFRDPSWAEQKKIDVRPGVRAISLNTALRRVTLSDGSGISYDRLLIATGSDPISLSIPGIKLKGVTTLRTLHEAETILEGSVETKESVIVGGGFVGLKLACHLKEKGFGVTVLEKEAKLAPRMLDSKASRLIREELEKHEIKVETDVEVAEILNEKGWAVGILMKDGRVSPCRKVIQAVGVRPNTQWLTGSGIDLKGGIPVDERMETNVSGVYGAGDVVVTVDSITSEWVNNATWPAATRQGAVAGSNMAGASRAYSHNFALNALTLFGLQVMAAGQSYYEGAPEVDVSVEERNRSYRKIVTKAGHIIGFILIGDVSGAGFLLSRMKRREERSPELRDSSLLTDSFQNSLPPNLGFRHGSIFMWKGESS